MFIAEQIKKLDFKPIILSKGYGGNLSGPKKVITEHKTFDVGDEAVITWPVEEGVRKANCISLFLISAKG